MTRVLTPATDPNRARSGLPVRAVVGLVGFGLSITACAMQGGDGAIFAAIAVAAYVLAWLASLGRGRARYARVRAEHGGDDVVEVWGSAELGATLTADDVDGPVDLPRIWSTGFSLVLGDEGLTLWRGGADPRKAASIPWSRIEGVGHGFVCLWELPAADLRMSGERTVSIAPVRRPGSSITGSRGAADLLITAISSRRRASCATS